MRVGKGQLQFKQCNSIANLTTVQKKYTLFSLQYLYFSIIVLDLVVENIICGGSISGSVYLFGHYVYSNSSFWETL